MNYTQLNLYDYFYNLVKQIPEGCITTYGELARALGDIRAARAVGYMLSINQDPDKIPCYKVVHTDRRMGKYALGVDEKEKRLRKDGIEISNGIVENFRERLFSDFKTDYPLKKLQDEQENIASMANFTDQIDDDNFSAIDVSYDGHMGYGTLISYDRGEYNIKNIEMEVDFPYIPGYLGYRETPLSSNFPISKDLATPIVALSITTPANVARPHFLGCNNPFASINSTPFIPSASFSTKGVSRYPRYPGM